MTDPARHAKPVGPPPPGGLPPSGPPRDDGPEREGPGAPPAPPYVRVYQWSSGGQSFPWFAVLLVVLGIGLLIELLIPDLSFGSLIILAAGIAFAVAWLYGRIVGATMPALILIAWGLASVGRDFGILTGDGWNTLFIGVAFILGWALGPVQRVRRQWALVVGLVLGVIGLADVSDALPFDVSIAVVIPLAMIAIGAYVVWRSGVLRRA
jgi:hypothetical protein